MRRRLWILDGLQSTGLALAVTAFYTLMITLQQSLSWEDVLAVFPLYLALMGGLMAAICAMTAHRVQLQVAISLGLTRRESWGGIHLLRLIPAVGVSVLTAVLAAVGRNPWAAPWMLLVLSLGVQLFCAALGTLLGLVYLKWGKFGTLLTVLMAIFAGGLGGFGAVMGFETLGVDRLFSGDVLPWLILAFGAICYGLVQIPEGRTLAHMQVRI
ncbi:MAG TPA: hypothetical protein IAA70_01380 [Candidatus Avoscillospira stercoripullorum]|uniref:Uncharacterized protein n=1 Tax=Candidatus Avoscillospira stercoripullorum TaxID=2840709 RepID=A0A9D1A8B9_9FIRM|nr:hypothetical protein [Candidatus Avoscillospira stercoripullorum]